MKNCLSIIAAFCITYGLQAQVSMFDLPMVPEAVKKDANVIIRAEDIVFEVTDIDKATLKVHKIVTIQNEKGRSELSFWEQTSKLTSLGDASIAVYDLFGRQLYKYKKKDMRTFAIGEGLIDDGFATGINVPAPSYPCTVEVEYEKKYKSTLWIPTYYIVTPGQGVMKSSYTVKVPKDMDLRYKEKNIKLAPQITEEGAYRLYKWSVTNMPPIEDEAGAVGNGSRYPSILLAPNHFSYFGNPGELTSWKTFGAWIGKLFQGLDELPEDRKAFFRDLVKNAPNDREKVKLIYDYLQKNFRYVSIQLGIGGYKPFPADFTDKKKYGDCKGLSMYMRAALKAVEIKSYVAIINSGYNSEPVDKDFPSNFSFNHAILCVPQPKDSIWLECTSQTATFAVLSTNTENRNALLITDEGGALVPTPVSQAGDNQFVLTTTVKLAEDGSGETNTVFSPTGGYKEYLDAMLKERKDDQKEAIVNGFGFKQPDDFDYAKKDSTGLYTTVLNMAIEKVPEFTAGNKMFLAPRLYKFCKTQLPKYENRKLDYYFHHPYIHTDTTIFKLPANTSVEALPKPKELSCTYATYTTKYWYNETEKAVYSTASLVLKQNRIPAAGYAEIKKLFDEVLTDANQRIVVKKE
jgi:transglutaminase-like putative cysteine protease